MRIELSEGLGFSAAHFIVGHERCEHLHGHNWRVGVTVDGEPDERGWVVDFLELKHLLREICESYDHRLLLPKLNSALEASTQGGKTRIVVHGREFEFPSEDVVWVPVVNTTVEELARVIADELMRGLSRTNVRKVIVRVEEAPGQWATEERVVRP